MEVAFAPTTDKKFNNTVIIGNNGAGKSTILEGLATSLSWFIARIKSEKGNGTPISELRIKNNNNAAAITIHVEDANTATGASWILTKARKGRKSEKGTQLNDLSKLVTEYRLRYTKDSDLSFPLIIFYDANRGVLDIPLKIRGKHNFEQLDGYDNSLRGSVDYRRFFEWYREREDSENETKLKFFNNLDIRQIKASITKEIELLSDKQLGAVRTALEVFLPDFTNFRIERKPRLHMAVEKNGQTLNVEQLSQGEKLTMALVGDIARRLAIMNPTLPNVLEGYGVILIDEAELHLHPKWQRTLIGRLAKTFPNCQFILSTHSPLAISDEKNILCYSLDDGELAEVDSLFGADVNNVLIDAMDTEIRNHEIEENINSLRENVQDKNLERAKYYLKKLEKVLPENHLQLIKSRLLIRRLQLNK